VALIAAQDPQLVARLLDRDYSRLAGNRFGRLINDIPVAANAGQDERRTIIDVLVPAHTSRPRHTRRFGQHLVTKRFPDSPRLSVGRHRLSSLS
jgi:hypothetical protein